MDITLSLLSIILMSAAAACLTMWRKGHYHIVAPVALPLAWMSVACILWDVRSISQDDFVLMMGLGLFVLCMNIIIGAGVYIYIRTRP